MSTGTGRRTSLAIATVIPARRNYLRVSTYSEHDLPLESLWVIGNDTVVDFAWLSSRAFWLWTHVVRHNISSATTHTAYMMFPAPPLGRKNRNRLEIAADSVLRSRGFLMAGGSLLDLYDTMPEQLQWAHDELDAVAEDLLDIPAHSDEADVMRCVLSRYHSTGS